MSSIFYNISQGIKQLFKNKGTTTASIFAITAMMIILGLFFVISINMNLFTEIVKQDYDTVEIFLNDSATEKQARSIMEDIKTLPGADTVEYRTKEQALEIMKERWGDNAYLLDSLGENPLPNSVIVHVQTIEAANGVNKAASKIDGVESTKYYKETVDKLTKVTKGLQIGSLVIMAFLIIISMLVVANTIKLTVFARAKEISIMKYIGATNWFVRGPFLVEGIIIGALSSLLSSALVFLVYDQIVETFGDKVMMIMASPMVPSVYMIKNLTIIFLAMGISIGACGSIISMRKFLQK